MRRVRLPIIRITTPIAALVIPGMRISKGSGVLRMKKSNPRVIIIQPNVRFVSFPINILFQSPFGNGNAPIE
jgi:hypothetical protein